MKFKDIEMGQKFKFTHPNSDIMMKICNSETGDFGWLSLNTAFYYYVPHEVNPEVILVDNGEPEKIRECMRVIKTKFSQYQIPPLKLPPDSIIEATVRGCINIIQVKEKIEKDDWGFQSW